jgi:hypothetical protein
MPADHFNAAFDGVVDRGHGTDDKGDVAASPAFGQVARCPGPFLQVAQPIISTVTTVWAAIATNDERPDDERLDGDWTR